MTDMLTLPRYANEKERKCRDYIYCTMYMCVAQSIHLGTCHPSYVYVSIHS